MEYYEVAKHPHIKIKILLQPEKEELFHNTCPQEPVGIQALISVVATSLGTFSRNTQNIHFCRSFNIYIHQLQVQKRLEYRNEPSTLAFGQGDLSTGYCDLTSDLSLFPGTQKWPTDDHRVNTPMCHISLFQEKSSTKAGTSGEDWTSLAAQLCWLYLKGIRFQSSDLQVVTCCEKPLPKLD